MIMNNTLFQLNTAKMSKNYRENTKMNRNNNNEAHVPYLDPDSNH